MTTPSGTQASTERRRGDISLCALVPYPPDTTPSQRFRIEQWLPHLAGQGIAVDLLPFVDPSLMRVLHRPGHLLAKAAGTLRGFSRRLRETLLARRYDAVLVHRGATLAGPAVVERLLRAQGRPLIYDFDDAIFLLDVSQANRRFAWLKFPGKTATICRLSNHVVVANPGLAEYAGRFNSMVTVVPSSVDTERFTPAAKTPRPGPVVIGWTGSSTSQRYLEAFADLLREVQRRHPVELRVHSDRQPDLPGVRFTWVPWTPEHEVEELRSFDIGIMPMPDDPWTRGKSAMKALLCMAVGIPVVCSNVGTNQGVIRHGENGLLAATPEEWLASLGALVVDERLRGLLGRAGRTTVEQWYSARICAERFGQVVLGTLVR